MTMLDGLAWSVLRARLPGAVVAIAQFSIPFHRLLKIALLALHAGLGTAAPARAEEYPIRAIRIIVPFSPGGPNDLIGRPLAEKMSEALGQPVVVENRPGAQGQIGTLAVARATPDGYTLLMTTGSHVANQVFYARLQYDPLRDFAPITQLAQSYGSVMVSRPGLEAKTASDLIALARQNPGKFSFGHPGVGNANHIAGELFQKIASVQLLAVPYKGSGSYVTDVISGQVDLAFMSSVLATPNVQSGLLRALATTGPRRAPSLPDVPTFIELGYPDFNWIGYFGLWFPAGTPRERIELISSTAKKALDTPELKRVIVDGGLELVGSTPKEFARYLEKDYAHQRAVMQRIGLQPQ